MLNYLLISGGLLAVALGGWRVTHSEAPPSTWSGERVLHEDSRYRAVEGRWTADDSWAVGKIEFEDNRVENPEEEDYRKQVWIGSQIEIRARPYWAKQIWPRTWVWVNLEFPSPKQVLHYRYHRDGEQVPSGPIRHLSLMAKFSAGDSSIEFELKRAEKMHWKKEIRRSNVGWRGGLILRENDARNFVEFLRLRDPGTPINASVMYYDSDINRERRMFEIAEHSFEFTTPPESIWAAFPELTYWPWQKPKMIKAAKEGEG